MVEMVEMAEQLFLKVREAIQKCHKKWKSP